VVRRAGILLAALEKDRAPVIADLPLFARVPDPPEADPVASLLAEVDPDTLSARAALDLIYRLKALVPDPEAKP
jgi:DNA mismatch repair protein MutS